MYKGRDEKSGQSVAIKMLSKTVINAYQLHFHFSDDYLREGLVSEIKVM